jgi:hypothetical protein
MTMICFQACERMSQKWNIVPNAMGLETGFRIFGVKGKAG